MKPFYPSPYEMRRLEKLLKRNIPDKYWAVIDAYISDLECGQYYLVRDVFAKHPTLRNNVSNIWNTLIAAGIIKRREFAHKHPSLVHTSDLERLENVIRELKRYPKRDISAIVESCLLSIKQNSPQHPAAG